MLVVGAWRTPPALRLRLWTGLLLAVELAQIVVGLWQARTGLPIVLVNIHMVLAVLLVAAMTAVVMHLKAPASPGPRADRRRRPRVADRDLIADSSDSHTSGRTAARLADAANPQPRSTRMTARPSLVRSIPFWILLVRIARHQRLRRVARRRQARASCPPA